MTRALLLLAFVLVATPAFAQLTMSVRPGAVAFAPAAIEVRLLVDPGGRQREVELVIDGDHYYRASLFPIRSEPDAPSVQPPASYRELPPGEYEITATLTDCAPTGCGRREPLRRVEAHLRVIGHEELPDPER